MTENSEGFKTRDDEEKLIIDQTENKFESERYTSQRLPIVNHQIYKFVYLFIWNSR